MAMRGYRILRVGAAGLVALAMSVGVGVPALAATPVPPCTAGPAPTVTGISPDTGLITATPMVTITGTNFDSTALSVMFTGDTSGKSSPATNVVDVSPTEITANAPASPSGQQETADITVSESVPEMPATLPTCTSDTDTATLSAGYAYLAPVPTVSAVSPTAGLAGSTVTVTGTGFSAVPPSSLKVAFGQAAPVTPASVTGDTTLTVAAPAQTPAAQQVDVRVITPPVSTSTTSPFDNAGGGESPAGPGDRFTYLTGAAPTISDFAPKYGPVTGGESVRILGTGLTGVTGVTIGGVPASSFTPVSDSEVDAVVASTANPGAVVVTTPFGLVSSSGTYTPTGMPIVDQVALNSGPLAGGNSVTVTGGNLSGATFVDFGVLPATTFTVNSDTSVTATAPAGTTGPVTVTVGGPNGSSPSQPTTALLSGDSYTYQPAGSPAVTALSPSSGPLVGGGSVTVTGSGFTVVTCPGGVKFGATAATVCTVVSDTQLTVTAPSSSAAQSVPVTVTNSAGTSVNNPPGDVFNYLPLPKVTTVSPSAGPPAGGNTVVVSGSGLTGGTVSFGSVAATGTRVLSDQEIAVTAPAGSVGPAVNVTVTGPAGAGTSVTSTSDRYSYLAAPTVTGLSPDSAGVAGSGVNMTPTVTISGTGFDAGSSVLFGQVAASGVTVVGPTQLTVTAPEQMVQSVDVTVTDGEGLTSAVNRPGDVFTYETVPTVTAVNPTYGPTVGGTSVTVTGTGFAGTSAVAFCPSSGSCTPAASYVVDSPTQLKVTTPSVATGGFYDIEVTNPAGTSSPTGSDQFDFVGPPTVSMLSPTTGPSSGGTSVTITGTDFSGASAVDFGSVPASSYTVDSAGTSIKAISPAQAPGIVDVTVTTPSGTSAITNADKFTYTAATPVVTKIAPGSGPTTGGTSVTITGSGFDGASCPGAVSFGTIAASACKVVSDTQLTATSPAEPAGTVHVTVTTSGGTSATSPADQFTFTPTVSSVSPNSGPTAGGTSVQVTGSGFTGASCPGAVMFGSTAASACALVSDTELTATSPAESAGTVDVRVTVNGVVSPVSSADQFTFGGAPSVASVAPASGPVAGGTSVTVMGANLSGATGVKFGSVAATFTVVSSTQLTATSPAQAAGGVDVTVTTPAGTSAVNPGDKFTYAPVPAVSGVSPAGGPDAGGTPVVITGSGFTGAVCPAGVKFGTVAATGCTVVSDTQIDATTPAAADGPVDVTVTGPGGTSPKSAADTFTFAPAMGYTPLSPVRILDTRGGTGGVQGPLTANQAYPVQVTGLAGVPATATAVAMNVTAVAPSAIGNLRVYPDGAPTPNASTVNYIPGRSVANFVVTALPADGKVDIYSDGARVNVLFDVVGYYDTASGYQPETPTRIVNTAIAQGGVTGPLAKNTVYRFTVAGTGPVPANAAAVTINVTAVAPNTVGNLRVFPDGSPTPTTSNINYIPGQATADFVTMQLPADGKIDVFSDNASVNVIFDVVGYYGSTAKLVTQPPVRILDTRPQSGTTQGLPSPLPAGTVEPFAVAGHGGVPAGAESVLLQVVAIRPAAGSGNLRVFPGDETTAPDVSTINYNGSTVDVANFVTVRLAANGMVNLFSDGSTVDVAVDVVGWFPAGS